ncbi:hypothetical protein FQN55_005449 [Onygenales sp. PD_40]|nr:hypothetical protein FQN55_005449 [Onygenales sp. PD_40]KAK2806862.1 hypothetical protein FQN51_005662 [Onygenales sp. PD_10]
MSEPESLKWTLRFKNHNVTVLLLVSPRQPFDSIKEDLLKALKIRNITEINKQPIPENAADIEFGLPIERNNLEKGWEKMRPPPQETADDKQPARGRKTANISPEGLDLKDSQAVAFRFRKAGEQAQDELEIGLDDPGWDVEIPKYEEAEDDEE